MAWAWSLPPGATESRDSEVGAEALPGVAATREPDVETEVSFRAGSDSVGGGEESEQADNSATNTASVRNIPRDFNMASLQFRQSGVMCSLVGGAGLEPATSCV